MNLTTFVFFRRRMDESNSSGLTLKECVLCNELPPTTAAAAAPLGDKLRAEEAEIAAAFTRHFVRCHLAAERHSRRKECKYCLEKFEDPRGLGRHSVRLHLFWSNFFCPHCADTFSEDYGTHFSRHHRHLCLLCTRTLRDGHDRCARLLLLSQLDLLEAENVASSVFFVK
jgi:transposase-like protein